MKGILIGIISVALIISLALPCFCSEPKTEMSETEASNADSFDMESYLTEKIVPVIMGVATSLVALFGGLAKIRGAVNGLDKTGKEITQIRESVSKTMSGLERELRNGLEELEMKIDSIPEIKEGYKEIKESCKALTEQNGKLLEALCLGFESIPEAVKCGNAHKIAILTGIDIQKESEK